MIDQAARAIPASKYDGVTELWFDEVASFDRCFSDDEYIRVVRPDELKLFDLAAAEILISEENLVVA